MNQQDVVKNAFAMPLTSPAFPPGPYRFINREFFTITYRTDPELLRDVVPEPLVPNPEGLVKFEFIRMPNSTGFGDYTESGQVIPVTFDGQEGGYSHAMYLDDEAPIAGGRELWGFPKKLGSPKLSVHKDTLLGTLDIGPVRIATATMGFKYTAMDHTEAKAAVEAPAFLLKIIPHVDCTPRICEPVITITSVLDVVDSCPASVSEFWARASDGVSMLALVSNAIFASVVVFMGEPLSPLKTSQSVKCPPGHPGFE